MNFLLSDELHIDEDDYLERQLLVQEFSKQPEEFFSQMRHFQPQVGCLNCCAICSKKASTAMEYWGSLSNVGVFTLRVFFGTNHIYGWCHSFCSKVEYVL